MAPSRRVDLVVDELDAEASIFDRRYGNTFHMNETAYTVWKLCDGHTTTRHISNQVTNKFDVDFDVALDHVEELVVMFADNRLVEVQGE